MLFLRDDGTLLIGEAASRRAVTEPSREARDFKRRMGDDVPIRMGPRSYRPQELTGHLLRWVVDTVSEREGGRPAHVVLTCPAEWGDYRRGLLVEAASAAGLDDVGLLPEPVAAATWYAAQERVESGALIAVYDLGGGTFDASVVRKTATGFEVHGEAGGDDAVGGIDFDHALLRHVCAAAGVDVARLDPEEPAAAGALAQVFAAVVEAKEALSADIEAVVPVVLPGLTRQVTVTRGQFEDLVRQQITGTVHLFGQIVRRAGADPARLRATLLVGGSSRIPLVAKLLRSELGARVAVDTHPKYAVSLGAAIVAAPRVEPDTAPAVARPPVVAQAPAREPPVARPVDLASTGLTAPTDVKVVLPQPKRIVLPVVTDRDDRVVIRTREGGRGFGRRLSAVALGVAVVAAAAVAVAALRGGTAPSGPRAAPGAARGTPSASGAPSTVGSANLAGAMLADPAGVDGMHAVAALPSGDLVAVGDSVDLHPRAWVRRGAAGTPWRAAPPSAPAQGDLLDVAVAAVGGRPRVVAVGWIPGNGGHRAAVWVSDNGDKWRLLDPSPDLAAAGIRELTAVLAVRSGGFLAVAIDKAADPDNGDSAVFRSADGLDWKRVPATGLDGPGSQQLHRIAQTPDGRLVAVGASLSGARLAPYLWTSGDGIAWDSTGFTGAGEPDLQAVVPLADGALLACGSLGSAGQQTAGCWTQRGPVERAPWQAYRTVTAPGSPSPQYIYDVLAVPGGLLAVGVGRDGTGVDAAGWSLTLQPG